MKSYRYGYTPLPKTLDKELLDERLSTPGLVKEKTLEYAREWYILDENATPPVYILRNLDSLDDTHYWKVVAPALLEGLNGLPFDENLCKGLLVNRSVTEYEVKSALSRENGDTARIFWFNREFTGGVSRDADPSYSNYCDFLDDPMKRQRYEELKQWMLANIPLQQRKVYNHASFESFLKQDEEWNSQFTLWKNDVVRYLHSSLQDIIEMRQSWQQSACGLDENMSGQEVGEMIHHARWAADKLHDFVGRENLVNSALDHIFRDTHSGSSNLTRTAKAPFQGVNLAIIGVSGSGKTALMAHVAGQVYLRQQQSPDEEVRTRPVISRFCGTSSGSYTGLNLVRSICRQIHFSLDHDMADCMHVLSMSYPDVVNHLSQLLKDHPVVLFVDSLDQLADDDLARSKITFLRDLTLHKHTRVVVSALPDERDLGKLFIS